MKKIDDIRNKIDFYYRNPEEYKFLVGLLNDRSQLNDFLKPSLPHTLSRTEKKDRAVMMRIIYILAKLTKNEEIMDIGNAKELIGPSALKNGERLFYFCPEVILGVLVALFIGIIVAIYMNIYIGIVLTPIFCSAAFHFVKQNIENSMSDKVLTLGNEMIKNDKNRYL